MALPLLSQLPTCKSVSRMVVLYGLFSKLPASPGREQINACAHPRGGLPNKFILPRKIKTVFEIFFQNL